MAVPDADTLSLLAPLFGQLRHLRSLTEKSNAVFHFGGQPFVTFEADGATPPGAVAVLRGAAPTRFPVNTPVEQRKFMDEAKKRLARLTDD